MQVLEYIRKHCSLLWLKNLKKDFKIKYNILYCINNVDIVKFILYKYIPNFCGCSSAGRARPCQG